MNQSSYSESNLTQFGPMVAIPMGRFGKRTNRSATIRLAAQRIVGSTRKQWFEKQVAALLR